MLFDLSNYWIFILVIAAIYVAISTFVQTNVGGKGRFKKIQEEMKDLQVKMMAAGKSKNDKELDELFKQNWKLTMEMMKLQFMMFGFLLVVLALLIWFFPMVEAGLQDDIHVPLYDDGLSAHCDTEINDGIFSNCYAIPADAEKGAWVVDAYLRSSTNESIARNATAIYVDGGVPQDIWLQAHSQGGIWDGLMGKTPYTLNITTDKQNYALGETVSIHAFSVPAKPEGSQLTAVIDAGTRFQADLPFALPLINIRRIIGSYGVFLFSAFLLSMAYTLGKAVYTAASKKKP
ncbi:MAG: EMC3/TMCO1 family protein [Candidatus Micrarchaeota archaeon]|nr:EMC3/TMCO1 family protein [Candidatus Micrarchaeota archaeon]